MKAPKTLLVRKHIDALKKLKGYTVSAGWFDTARYAPSSNGSPGPSVAYIARINEFGATIQIPARSQAYNVEFKQNKSGEVINKFVKLGTGTISNSGTANIPAYTIVIPPRPFMNFAFENFKKGSVGFKKKLANNLFNKGMSPDNALKEIAYYLESCIVMSIKDGPWEANSYYTIKNKGFDKPLIDKGIMWQTVTSKISKKD